MSVKFILKNLNLILCISTYLGTIGVTYVISKIYIKGFNLAIFADYKFIWFVFGLNIITTGIYWIIGFVYIWMDHTKKPSFLQKYKMDRKNEVNVDWPILKDVLIKVLFNQLVIQVIFTIIIYPFYLIRGGRDPRTLPSIPVFLFEVYVSWFTREFIFYYGHLLLHTRVLYRFIHKKHHTWKTPIAVSALYCEPFEMILTNIIPILIGPFIVSAHYISYFAWFTHVMLSTLHKHSGYNIPWYYNSTIHNTHHDKCNTNYGLIGIMDWIHGTNYKKVKNK